MTNVIEPTLARTELSQCLENEAQDATNPYLVAKIEWNNMFYDLTRARRNWQIFSLLLLLGLMVCTVALTVLAKQKPFVPYIVHVDALGDAQFVKQLKPNEQIHLNEYRAFLDRYIKNVFAVIQDPIWQRQTLDYVYAVSHGEAKEMLNQHFQENDPFKLAETENTEAQVQSILPRSDHSWQISWITTTRDVYGKIIMKKNYEGLVTLKQYPIYDHRQLLLNPLGLFVDYFSWSLKQPGEE
jgi:type IV secretory pathway TrbF-like protein